MIRTPERFRPIQALLAMAVLAGGVTGCGTNAPTSTEGGGQPSPAAPSTANEVASGTFAAPAETGEQPTAVTYDATMVPFDAKATVEVRSADQKTEITLTVQGLTADHKYGAHVHTKPCGADPADSGPHYQDKIDPVTPSTDPAYANAQNEVWLDFTTDGQGAASATATQDWTFRAGEANSVVIHAAHTATKPGKAGTAGNRLACIKAAFAG